MISKEFCKKELDSGKSIRQIGRENGIPNKTLNYWVNKWKLISKYNKPVYNELYFEKIDSKEKAYILGFLLADSSFDGISLEIGLMLEDIEFLNKLSSEIGSNITKDLTCIPEKRRFPRCRTHIKNKTISRNIRKLFGGCKKIDRHIPIIKKSLQLYLLLGFFDGDGCITYGIRKDRNRFWGKIYFTSQLKMLEGIQNILIDFNISSSIIPRKKEKCFDLYIRTKDFFKFCELIDNLNFNSLQRKHKKIKALLRPKSDEFGEIIRQHRAKLSEREGVETTGVHGDMK